MSANTTLQRRARPDVTSVEPPSKRKKALHPIDLANSLSDEEFIDQYLKTSEPQPWTQWTHPKTKTPHDISLCGAKRLKPDELEQCFAMIEQSSGDAYRSSSVGWHPAAKRKEMRLPDLRYLLLHSTSSGQDVKEEKRETPFTTPLDGFASFMPTWEDGYPVVYCYEIHLKPNLQGTGLGRHLMSLVTRIAERLPSVEKTMLTCFLANEGALRFYEKLGFAKDEFSPTERTLRGGKVVISDYVILSLQTTRSTNTSTDTKTD